jgi:hypothetical protein
VVLSCIAFLTLGAKSIRASLSLTRLLSSNFVSDHPRFLPCISIIGSLLIHAGATVVTAVVLAASNAATTAEPPLSRMILLWPSRPLASAFIAWLSIADRKAYHDTAREVAIVDSLYSCINIYLFCSVAKITNVRPSDVPAPARLARAGSALWLLAFVLSLGAVVWYVADNRTHTSSRLPSADEDNNGKNWMNFANLLPWIWFLLDSIRFLACWLLWAGLLFTDETAFCPSQRALAGVTVIWLVVPFLDCLWRGFATYKEEEGGVEAEILMER